MSEEQPKLNIKDEIVNEAADCKKDLRCLKNRGEGLCKVDTFLNNKILFVRCLNSSYCSFRLPFGDIFVCECLVRKEIYNLYKI
ncbi:MAG: hypothetical protein HQL06_00270 [Nitrospirae bacterium]|nr:hypothetical protein [Nitrospirota bacterium]